MGIKFEIERCDPGVEAFAAIETIPDARSKAREAMVRARAALRTCSLDKAEDLELPARQYVIGKRIAELTEAIGDLDKESV